MTSFELLRIIKTRSSLYFQLFLLLSSSSSFAFAFIPSNGLSIRDSERFLHTKHTQTSRLYSQLKRDESDLNHVPNNRRSASSSSLSSVGRRKALILGLTMFLPFTPLHSNSQAITKEFPLELTYTDSFSITDTNKMDQYKNIREQMSNNEASKRKLTMEYITKDPLVFHSLSDFVAALLWGSALWFLAGSRSNPLVTPLANALYEPDQQFVRDRNDGYFSSLPPSLMFILFAVFLFLGFLVDRSLTLLLLGDSDIVLQLAGVSLIAGAALELGRISAGEKVGSREELDRMNQLQTEFDTFANQRLVSGGNVHRQEIVNAFRRFHAKYRNRDDENLLSDLEIERLMRLWVRVNLGIDMSSAGYFNGVQLNNNADIVKTTQT
jgi:hypothetical protein